MRALSHPVQRHSTRPRAAPPHQVTAHSQPAGYLSTTDRLIKLPCFSPMFTTTAAVAAAAAADSSLYNAIITIGARLAGGARQPRIVVHAKHRPPAPPEWHGPASAASASYYGWKRASMSAKAQAPRPERAMSATSSLLCESATSSGGRRGRLSEPAAGGRNGVRTILFVYARGERGGQPSGYHNGNERHR